MMIVNIPLYTAPFVYLLDLYVVHDAEQHEAPDDDLEKMYRDTYIINRTVTVEVH